MTTPPDQVGIPVCVHILHQNGYGGIAPQSKLRVENPAVGTRVHRSFSPAVWSDHIRTTVSVDVTRTNPMAGQLIRQRMALPLRLRARLQRPPRSKLNAVRQYIQTPVAVNVHQTTGLHGSRSLHDCPIPLRVQASRRIRMPNPVQTLTAIIGADKVRPSVPVDIQRQIRVVILPSANHLHAANSVSLPARSLIPVIAADNVHFAITVHVQRCTRTVAILRIQ